jgi:nucleoside-triphosphatase
VDRLARDLRARGVAVGGFLTEEVRERGHRAGFTVKSFDGQRALMAHIDWTTGCLVGHYRVDVAAFDRIAMPAIEQALNSADVIIIDEIGPMELCSRKFGQVIGDLFSATAPLIATVHANPDPITDELKKRTDVELVKLSAANRDRVLTRLLASVRDELPYRGLKPAYGPTTQMTRR